MKSVFNFIIYSVLSFIIISPEQARATSDGPPKSLLDSKSSSKSLTPEERQARREKAQAAQSLKIYKKVKDKAWEELSKKEQKYAVKNGIPNKEAYDAWKAQQADLLAKQKEARKAAEAARAAAKKAKEEAKAYKRVKNKSWEELTNKELKYAEKHGITTKEMYDAWKAAQAALVAQKNGKSSTAEGESSMTSSTSAAGESGSKGRAPASVK